MQVACGRKPRAVRSRLPTLGLLALMYPTYKASPTMSTSKSPPKPHHLETNMYVPCVLPPYSGYNTIYGAPNTLKPHVQDVQLHDGVMILLLLQIRVQFWCERSIRLRHLLRPMGDLPFFQSIRRLCSGRSNALCTLLSESASRTPVYPDS